MARATRYAFANLAAVTLLLTSCASNSGLPVKTADAPPPQAYRQNAAVTVIGTPFYALFKLTGCILTVAVAAPGAALLEMTNRPNKDYERAQLDAGVSHNCGGSYVLGRS